VLVLVLLAPRIAPGAYMRLSRKSPPEGDKSIPAYRPC